MELKHGRRLPINVVLAVIMEMNFRQPILFSTEVRQQRRQMVDHKVMPVDLAVHLAPLGVVDREVRRRPLNGDRLLRHDVDGGLLRAVWHARHLVKWYAGHGPRSYL